MSVQDQSSPFVVQDDSSSSLLNLKVGLDNPHVEDRMPFNLAPLTGDEIVPIRGWIDQSAEVD